ncbi:MAG: sulfite exporter TauE/SafE family protein [Cyclobacteriaceae bacterium]|nr:sulfite exporter TauE/SafE family protein [Cyclobacteriaceae bacterium]
MEILGYVLAIVSGAIMGMLGGGGSIVTVPIFVYIFQMSPVVATGYSLFVVGITASVGSFNFMRRKLLSYKTAIIFAVPSFLGVYMSRHYMIPNIPENIFSLGRHDITSDIIFFFALLIAIGGTMYFFIIKSVSEDKRLKRLFWLVVPAAFMLFVTRQYLIPILPDELIVLGAFTLSKSTFIMVFFSFIMLFSAVSMIRPPRQADNTEEPSDAKKYTMIMIQGTIVGMVTGIVGAGGGFLIVPALVLMARLPIQLAVGTSLLIIAANSLIGFAGDVNQQPIEWTFLLSFTGFAVTGMLLGIYLGKFISPLILRKGFGYFLILMASFILTQELFY